MSWYKAGSLLEAPWHEMEVPRSKKKGTVLQVGLDLFMYFLTIFAILCLYCLEAGWEGGLEL